MNLRESLVVEPLNAWIAELFGPAHRGRTVATLLAAHEQTLVDIINEAQAQRAAARADLDSVPIHQPLHSVDVEELIDSLGDMAAALTRADPDSQIALYQALRLELRYHHVERAVYFTASPRVVNVGVRGGLAR